MAFASIPLSKKALVLVVLTTSAALLQGCSEEVTEVISTCEAITGSPWVPQITGAGDCNHSDTGASTGVSVTEWSTTVNNVPVSGLGDAIGSNSRIITVSNIPMTDDLLENGSLSLVASVANYPANLGGSAWPVLISLHDGTQELVGMESGCASGLFTCSGSSCSGRRSGCEPDPAGTNGSAYIGTTATDRREFWEQHQGIYYVPGEGLGALFTGLSVNTFPTCNWSSGTPGCSFAATPGNFFNGTGKMRTGTYTAKYALIADSYTSVPTSYQASIVVKAVKKRDGNNGTGSGCNATSGHDGSIDLNIVLVGDKNVTDSRTEKGQRNLNSLFQHVYDQFYTQNSGTTNLRLGKITVFEWACASGGESYANESDFTAVIRDGSGIMPAETEGKALNIFIVSTVAGDTRVLGVSGGIGGPPVNGTDASGLIFASFEKLSEFNPSCASGTSCAIGSQEADFIDMGGTITHEIGHYLGLNHPSESSGTSHDFVPDTPLCTATANTSIGQILTHTSCRLTDTNQYPGTNLTCAQACTGYNGVSTFCASALECQFNHVMWYTTKKYGTNGTGDGNLFSPQAAAIIQYNPFVR